MLHLRTVGKHTLLYSGHLQAQTEHDKIIKKVVTRLIMIRRRMLLKNVFNWLKTLFSVRFTILYEEIYNSMIPINS